MIANGCPAARMVYQDMDAIEPYLGTMIPADADGDTPPPADAPAPLVSINQDGSGLPRRPDPDLERHGQLGRRRRR